MSPVGHEVPKRALEGGVARTDAKLLREEGRECLVPERHEPGRAAVAAHGDFSLETRPVRGKADEELLLVVPQPDLVDRRTGRAVGQAPR